jgi:thymidylate synthase
MMNTRINFKYNFQFPNMKSYLDIVRRVMTEGVEKENRTGVNTIAIAGAMFEHDMNLGFPMLTTKKMPFNVIKTELEFFIRGLTDKEWLKERKNNIWNEWAHPKKAPYGHDTESKQRMLEERDLGPVYGFQWRHFNAPYLNHNSDYTNQGIDQLSRVIDTLKTNPNDRRMLVMAWNPLKLGEMALPPCHYGFQVTVIDGKLNLLWNQRSVDVMLGLPFNIVSYATLLHLLAKETGLGEGKLVGFLADTHIYVNHLTGAHEQLSRDPDKFPLPRIETANFSSIFDWCHTDTDLIGYESYPKISFDIAV